MRKLAMDELGRISPSLYKKTPKMPVALVLDNVRSALNVGSIFRTSDSFLVEQLVLCGITARPPHSEINKTALGATESVAWKYAAEVQTAIEELKREGYAIWAVEQVAGSTPLQRFEVPQGTKLALVLGNEVEGVSDGVLGLCDGALEGPQFGSKHSLNVAVCAGIVVWEVFRKWKFA